MLLGEGPRCPVLLRDAASLEGDTVKRIARLDSYYFQPRLVAYHNSIPKCYTAKNIVTWAVTGYAYESWATTSVVRVAVL